MFFLKCFVHFLSKGVSACYTAHVPHIHHSLPKRMGHKSSFSVAPFIYFLIFNSHFNTSASLASSLQSCMCLPEILLQCLFFSYYALFAHLCNLHHCHMHHLFMRPSLLLSITLLPDNNDKCLPHRHCSTLTVTSSVVAYC